MELALALAPLAALAGALVFGWFCVRLSGVYLAMLTLAFAQIVWSIAFQWDAVTGGSNGLVGVWPAAWLAGKQAYYWFTLALVAAALVALAWIAHSPFGYALRGVPRFAAARRGDRHRRAAHAVAAFALAGAFAGPRRRALRVLEGQHLAGDAGDSALGRRAGDGAARRPQRARRAAARRRRVHLAVGLRSRAPPTTGARCSARRSCFIVLAFPMGIGGALRSGCVRRRDERQRYAQ